MVILSLKIVKNILTSHECIIEKDNLQNGSLYKFKIASNISKHWFENTRIVMQGDTTCKLSEESYPISDIRKLRYGTNKRIRAVPIRLVSNKQYPLYNACCNAFNN